jgi:hypothetical protein
MVKRRRMIRPLYNCIYYIYMVPSEMWRSKKDMFLGKWGDKWINA